MHSTMLSFFLNEVARRGAWTCGSCSTVPRTYQAWFTGSSRSLPIRSRRYSSSKPSSSPKDESRAITTPSTAPAKEALEKERSDQRRVNRRKSKDVGQESRGKSRDGSPPNMPSVPSTQNLKAQGIFHAWGCQNAWIWLISTDRYSYRVFLLHPPAHIRYIFIPPTIIYSRLFQDLLSKHLPKTSTSRCDLHHFLCRGNLWECHSISESSKSARSFWSWFRKRDARCHHQPTHWWRPLPTSHSPHQHRRIGAAFPTLCSTSTPGPCHGILTRREDFPKNEAKNLLYPRHSRRTDAPRRPNNIPTHRLAFPRGFYSGTVIYRRRWQQSPPDVISLPSTISTILNTHVDSPISFGKVLSHKSARRA